MFEKTLLFCNVTVLRLVVTYQCLRTTYQFYLHASPLKMRQIGYLETSVNYYRSMLCNIPEEQSLKARIDVCH
jgi:hypothetical protein